ncbi:MAG: hypothetical protein CVV50_01750 [Spirochaetae bacterium HGW-Spirochaetae-6]|nr:MAG: hypothetical protein CVV50_01750 [Spirochaetae bacterium HGW-Spirochaetae-6]
MEETPQIDNSLALKELTDKINKVMKYADGDISKAKEIVSGNYQDFIVVKGSMKSDKDGESGVFLVFVHRYRHILIDKLVVVAPGIESFSKITLASPWLAYFNAMHEVLENTKVSSDKMAKLSNEIQKELTPPIISQLIGKLQNHDTTSVSVQFEKICGYSFGNNNFIVQLDFENITSLNYEENVPPYYSKRAQKEQQTKEAATKKIDPSAIDTSDEFEAKKQILNADGNTIINGELSLSPVKGKFISELELGDVVGIKIKDNSKKAMNIIRQFQLMSPEGKLKKVKGKIIFLKKTEKGYTVLVQIAPLVIINIIEEEEIKVECYSPANLGSKSEKKTKSAAPLVIIGAAITFMILIALIIILNN